MEKQMKILLKRDSFPEVEEIMAFLETLTQDERKLMLEFVHGVELGYRMAVETGAAAMAG